MGYTFILFLVLNLSLMKERKKVTLTILCSDHPENASAEKTVLAEQQNLLNTSGDFFRYISCHSLSLASKTSDKYVLKTALSPSPVT